MKTRVIFILLTAAIIAGFGFMIDKTEQSTSSETMVGFYIDIYADNIPGAIEEAEYIIEAGGNEWISGTFNPQDNMPQVSYCAPVSYYYGEICVYVEYYGQEGCEHYKEICDQGYFTWPNHYDFEFEYYSVGRCDK
jgi:hypothetical protein